jgi:uncharacterized protein YdaU (DUF1376 family)
MHIGDYHKKAGRLTMRQHGAYKLLLDAIYDREQFPTRDEAIEWTWALSAEEVADVDFVLSRFFTLGDDGRYVQKRCAEVLEEYRAFCERQRAKGAKGGRPKEKPGETRRVNPANPEKAYTDNRLPLTDTQGTTSSGPADADRCPVGQIIELYREHARSLIQPRVVPDAVKAQITARWRQDAEYRSKAFWIQFFQQCETSDFLAGRADGRPGGKPFRAGLEWIVKASNFAKIINGNYDNQGGQHAQTDGRARQGRQSRSQRDDDLLREKYGTKGSDPADDDA